MAFKTYAQIASASDVQDGDLFATYRGTGPLKSITAAILAGYMAVKLAATWLQTANNLSDVANPAAARTNLAVLGIGNALSELAGIAATARNNIGALAATNPAYTGGSVGNLNTAGATTLDVSVADYHQRSISANTTFTLQGGTPGKTSDLTLELTIASAAAPIFTGVKWEGGSSPNPGNGRHLLGFLWNGTDWTGVLIALAVA
jgi:hypothetical protein